MDYRGQLVCEYLNTILNCLFGLVGFVVGWWHQSFWLTFLWCCGGLVVSALVCVPDWPFYNRNPLPWQPPVTLPGQVDPATGEVAKDDNQLCGTCVCGTSVHGVGCASHPDNLKANSAGGVDPATTVPATNPAAELPAVEIAEVKVRGSKKK